MNILSSPLNISAGCGGRGDVPVDRYKEFCCNKEIGVVDSLPLKYIAHKVDSNSGWEDDVDGLVEIKKEINVGVKSDGG